MWSILFIIIGAAILLGGGELLVRGAVALAKTLGISPMVIGLTVVAYATSAPELVVGVMAAARGNPAICAANVVGSNILNVLLVLGAAAVICPLQATATFIRREVPIMIAMCLLFPILVWDGLLSRWEAGLLVAALIIYTLVTIHIARRESKQMAEQYEDVQPAIKKGSILVHLLFIVVGLGMLSGGAELFVRGAVEAARWLGISETIIGLTLVAFGTSIPELVASVIAAIRRHPDICLGNIIGSNIYNIAAIAGISGLVVPLPIDAEMIHVHIPVMIGSAILLWILASRRLQIRRRDGIIFLGGYLAYLGWTIGTHLS